MQDIVDTQPEVGGLVEQLPSFVLPFVLVRRTGVSSSQLQSLSFSKTLQAVDQLLTERTWCLDNAKELANFLESEIGRISDAKTKQRVIQLRRDLHNDRIPTMSCGELDEVIGSGRSDGAYYGLKQWITLRHSRDSLIAKGEDSFQEELQYARGTLQRLFRHPNFQNGLLMASPVLSRELASYLAPNVSSLRRSRQIERSLIRYFSRSALKFSPFSTFLHSSIYELKSENNLAPSLTSGMVPRPHRAITVNQSLVARLVSDISRHKEFSDSMSLALSRDFVRDGISLCGIKKTYNNRFPQRMRIPRETVVSLPLTRSIEWIEQLLERRGRTIKRRTLAASMAQSAGCSDAHADLCIEALIAAGILEIHLPRDSNGAHALKDILTYLRQRNDPASQDLYNDLTGLGEKTSRSFGSTPSACARSLDEIAVQAHASLSTLGTRGEEDWSRFVVLEDYVSKSLGQAPFPASAVPSLATLRSFLQCCRPMIDNMLFYKRNLDVILSRELASDRVSLLKVVQVLGSRIAEYIPINPPLLQVDALNPFNLPELNTLLELRKEFSTAIQENSHAHELNLATRASSRSWMLRSQEVYDDTKIGLSCFSCFCQPIVLSNGTMGVMLNDFIRGPARPIARLLSNITSDSDRQKVIEAIEDFCVLQPGMVPYHIRASFDFNACLHPQLLDHALHYEATTSELSRHALTLGDLFVTRDADQRHYLTSSGGDRVFPIDFGMMSEMFHPAVYRLLELLGPNPMLIHRALHPQTWLLKDQSEPMIPFPRLTYNDCVLRRRGWSFRLDALPRRNVKDSELAYLIKIRAWQRQYDLPDEVFVRSTSITEWMSNHTEEDSRAAWNRRKPQYIKLSSLIFLSVFDKVVEETERVLYIEELLPDSTSHLVGDVKRSAEFVIDINCRDMCIASSASTKGGE